MTYEARLPRARAYYAKLSAERGRTVRPKLSTGWLFFRATRLPFLSPTFAPVLLGIAVAASKPSMADKGLPLTFGFSELMLSD